MRARGDVGETLIEIVLTIVIVGVTATALPRASQPPVTRETRNVRASKPTSCCATTPKKPQRPVCKDNCDPPPPVELRAAHRVQHHRSSQQAASAPPWPLRDCGLRDVAGEK